MSKQDTPQMSMLEVLSRLSRGQLLAVLIANLVIVTGALSFGYGFGQSGLGAVANQVAMTGSEVALEVNVPQAQAISSIDLVEPETGFVSADEAGDHETLLARGLTMSDRIREWANESAM